MSEEFIVTDDMLHAYADGELDAIYCDRMAQYLLDNPEKAAELQAWQDQKQDLAKMFNPILEETLPEALTEILESSEPAAIDPRASGWRPMAIAASLALVVGLGLGWGGARISQPEVVASTGVSPMQNALAAHLVYTADNGRPVELTAEFQEPLVAWLSKRLGYALSAPDFSAEGFALMGGRLIYENSNAAAQFMYENTAGQRITLYVAAAQADDDTRKTPETAFQIIEQGAATSFYWLDAPLGFAITGDLDRAQLLDVANSAYTQLSL